MALYQLIPNAFTILSDSYAKIGELASEAVRLGDVNSPKQPKIVNQLIEVGALYDSVFELVILNGDGDAIVGLNTDADTVNKLLLCLKQAAGLNDLSAFPTPLTVLDFNKCCGNSFPIGAPGSLLVSDGDEYVVLEKGPDGSVLTSTPTGLIWSSVVGNGLPSGGTTGQYLRKNSNTSYDVVWDTLSLSKITDVTASASEVNILDGATVSTTELNYSSGVTNPIQPQLDSKLSSTLPTGQFWVGVSNVATPVTPTGDVTFNTSGVFQITAGAIVDADVSGTAAISRSKLASGSANRLVINSSIGVMTDAAAINPSQVLVSDANGIPTHSGTSTTTLSYLDVSSSIQGSLNTKLTVNLSTPNQGDLIQFNGTDWVNFGIGLNGQVLTSNGSSAIWASSVANGVPSGGSANQILRKVSGTDYDTEWHTLVLTDITDVSTTFNEVNALSGLDYTNVTATQFNYLSGLNSNVQNQIDNKLSRSLNHNSLFIGDAGNIAVMLAPGNEGYILRITAGVPTWSPETPPGNVSGVAPSTDNAIVRWNGTGADSIQNSGIIIDDSDNVTGVTNLTIKTAGAVRTATSSGNTLLLQAYDVDGTAYTTFATLTAGNTPTFDLSDSVTKSGQYIYRSGGTDVSLADGGTGASLADPGADRILFWDDSAGTVTWLTLGSNLSITGTTINATGGGSTLQQKTEPGTTYSVTDADDGYIIYFTSVTGCTVTLPNTVTTDISFTGVRADGAGVITFDDDGTSVLLTINDQFTIDYEKGSATWVKNTATDWYGWGALGTSGGGGSVNSVSGTTNRITVSGTSTDPVIDIASTYVGQSSITTLGTISTGVWQGTPVGILYGGTGLSSLGTAAQLIRVNAGGTALEYFTPSYITGNQTITLSGDVTGSGTTSISTLISNDAVTTSKILNSNVTYGKIQNGAGLSVLGVTGSSAAALADISAGFDNQVLRRSGTSIAFGAINLASSNAVTSVLPIANGGTGSSSQVWWGLSGTSTLTGSTTITSNAASQLTFDGTYTTTNTNQQSILFGGTVTTRNSGADIFAVYKIAPTVTAGTTGHTIYALSIDASGIATTNSPTKVAMNVRGGAYIATDASALSSFPTLTVNASTQSVITEIRASGTAIFSVSSIAASTVVTIAGTGSNSLGFTGSLVTSSGSSAVQAINCTTTAGANNDIMRGIRMFNTFAIGTRTNVKTYGFHYNPNITISTGSHAGNYGVVIDGTTSSTVIRNGFNAGADPTAQVHIGGGTAAAGTAPLKINSGTAMTTPEDGAFEYHSSHLYFTIGSTRYQLDQQGGGGISGSGTSGQITYWNGTSSVTSEAGFEYDATNNTLIVPIARVTDSIRSSSSANSEVIVRGTRLDIHNQLTSESITIIPAAANPTIQATKVSTGGQFLIKSSFGNSTDNEGDDLIVESGSAYATTGDGSGGDLYLRAGDKRTAGSGSEGIVFMRGDAVGFSSTVYGGSRLALTPRTGGFVSAGTASNIWTETLAAATNSLSIYTERGVISDAAMVSTHSWRVTLNGNEYDVMLKAV